MNKESKYEKRISRAILSGTLNTAAWIFGTIAEMGILTVDVFFNPSIYAELPRDRVWFDYYPEKKKIKETTIEQNIRRLRKHGFVEKRGEKYLLTLAGRKLLDYIMGRRKILEKKWDKKYRVVVFDVPEKMRKKRNWLRNELYLLRYRQLQESVFISKFPLPADLVREIKKRKMGNFVNYLLVDRVYDIKAAKNKA